MNVRMYYIGIGKRTELVVSARSSSTVYHTTYHGQFLLRYLKIQKCRGELKDHNMHQRIQQDKFYNQNRCLIGILDGLKMWLKWQTFRLGLDKICLFHTLATATHTRALRHGGKHVTIQRTMIPSRRSTVARACGISSIIRRRCIFQFESIARIISVNTQNDESALYEIQTRCIILNWHQWAWFDAAELKKKKNSIYTRTMTSSRQNTLHSTYCIRALKEMIATVKYTLRTSHVRTKCHRFSRRFTLY